MYLLDALEKLSEINPDNRHCSELYEQYQNLHRRLEYLLNDFYIPLYRECYQNDYDKYFQEQGLRFPIFKYKDESPFSKTYYEMNTNNKITSINDILNFYHYIEVDHSNIIRLDNAVNSYWFTKMYNCGEARLFNMTIQFFNEYTIIGFDKLVVEIDDLHNRIKHELAINELIDISIEDDNSNNNSKNQIDVEKATEDLLAKVRKSWE